MTITPLKANIDDRGFTAEFDQVRTGTHISIYRKAGTISGRHYHKGLSATKNPEILILVHGKCTLNWYSIEDKIQHTATLEGPTKMEIPINTWHEVAATTDCVFIELNSIAEHIADTFYIS
jgi:dTDP-4-dehydrorhamnose 3,5-epimerase-like enzyme